MNNEYNKMLLSELIAMLAFHPKNDTIKKEIVSRLTFCGFDKDTILAIIKTEINIIRKRKLKDMPPLYKSYIWLDKNNELVGKRKLFNEDKERYYVYLNRPIKNTSLTLSELVWIYDEAFYISKIDRNHPKIVLDEVDDISAYEDSRSWVVGEFYSRLESIYRSTNNIVNEYKGLLIENSILCLYDNEVNILFSEKWRKPLGIKRRYQSYTAEYYKYLNKNKGGVVEDGMA